MTDVPELTDDEATVLRSMRMEVPAMIAAHDSVTSRGLHCTPIGAERLAAYDAKKRAAIEAPFHALLREDAAGRSVAELLDIAADSLFEMGGGPVEDCLRLKASEIRALIAKDQNQ